MSSVSTYDKKNYPKASSILVTGGIIAYIGGIFLLFAVFSPYWVQSFEKSFSSFKNMGLWQYCFYQFKFPLYQYNKNFHGCHSVYSQEYFVIREWLLPGWLLFSEIFMTFAILASLVCQLIVAMMVTRYPKHFVLKYEWILSCVCFFLSAAITFLTFFTLLIFYWKYESKNWLMYPKFNFLSWSYWSAFITFWLYFIATKVFYNETKRGYELRKESRNLIMRMHETRQSSHTSPSHHGFF